MKQETLSMFLWRQFHIVTTTDKDFPGSVLWEVTQPAKTTILKFRAFNFQKDDCSVEMTCLSADKKVFSNSSICDFSQVENLLNEPLIKMIRYMSSSRNQVHPIVSSNTKMFWRKQKNKFSVDLSDFILYKNGNKVQQFSCVERICDNL